MSAVQCSMWRSPVAAPKRRNRRGSSHNPPRAAMLLRVASALHFRPAFLAIRSSSVPMLSESRQGVHFAHCVAGTPGSRFRMTYLDKLNSQQRRAVEHGGAMPAEAGPLLIIAGAGSGKTNTLAHRVAHLIVSGADPRRMLLLTFSRRAAAEMSRRVEHITASAMRERANVMTASISWSGTFHAIGARVLREHAERIGIERTFTIHDREDSADLMNLIRHDLGFSKTEKRFPAKNACLAIYSRAVNA